jgi:hypothetical protein
LRARLALGLAALALAALSALLPTLLATLLSRLLLLLTGLVLSALLLTTLVLTALMLAALILIFVSHEEFLLCCGTIPLRLTKAPIFSSRRPRHGLAYCLNKPTQFVSKIHQWWIRTIEMAGTYVMIISAKKFTTRKGSTPR